MARLASNGACKELRHSFDPGGCTHAVFVGPESASTGCVAAEAVADAAPRPPAAKRRWTSEWVPLALVTLLTQAAAGASGSASARSAQQPTLTT